jgi:hypothetical protein
MPPFKEMSTFKEILSNGSTAHFIRGKDTDGDCVLMHFGFKDSSLVICMCCLAAHLFRSDEDIRDVAHWITVHWRRFRNGNGSNIPPHNKGAIGNVQEIQSSLASSLGVVCAKHSSLGAAVRPRNILLEMGWLRESVGSEQFDLLERKEDWRVCYRCLEPVGALGVKCCAKSHVLNVTRLKLGNNNKCLICTDDPSILADQKTLIQASSTNSRGKSSRRACRIQRKVCPSHISYGAITYLPRPLGTPEDQQKDNQGGKPSKRKEGERRVWFVRGYIVYKEHALRLYNLPPRDLASNFFERQSRSGSIGRKGRSGRIKVRGGR